MRRVTKKSNFAEDSLVCTVGFGALIKGNGSRNYLFANAASGMNDQAIERILASYEQIAPRVDDMVAGFYRRLFDACPEARPLFKKDMALQRQHLAATLAILVRNLPFLDVLEEPFMELGVQHVLFGARPEQYPVVRDSLLASLAESIGKNFTPEVEKDWTGLLDHVVAVMLKGATLHALKIATRPSQDMHGPRRNAGE
jgi:hemoglobin-like flavoprotein